MPSVVITGANRGIGEAFVKHYTSQPDYKVFGIVRNKKSAEEKFAKDGTKNVTFIEAGITDAKAMQAAAAEVSKATGGSLDILIPNAGMAPQKNNYKALPDFPTLEDIENDLTEAFQVNTIGAAFTTQSFLPLIRKGQMKKIGAISTGMALIELPNEYGLATAAPYSISKAALNSMVAKYNAALKDEGILIFSISPGFVATEMNSGEMDEEAQKAVEKMGAVFFQKYPNWIGQPITPQDSARMVADVIDKATIEKDGGKMVSHHGNEEWL